MPHYEIHHIPIFNKYQYREISEALTALHARLFNIPPSLVLITFHLAWKVNGNGHTDSDTQYMTLGYQRVWTNYVNVHLQPSPNTNPIEAKQKLNVLAEEINKIWNKYARPNMGRFHFWRRFSDRWYDEIANAADVNAPGTLQAMRSLHNIFVMWDVAVHVSVDKVRE
jgi:hypothetical protein